MNLCEGTEHLGEKGHEFGAYVCGFAGNDDEDAAGQPLVELLQRL